MTRAMLAVPFEPADDGVRCGECRFNDPVECCPVSSRFDKGGEVMRGPSCLAAQHDYSIVPREVMRALVAAGKEMRGKITATLPYSFSTAERWDAALAALEGME